MSSSENIPLLSIVSLFFVGELLYKVVKTDCSMICVFYTCQDRLQVHRSPCAIQQEPPLVCTTAWWQAKSIASCELLHTNSTICLKTLETWHAKPMDMTLIFPVEYQFFVGLMGPDSRCRGVNHSTIDGRWLRNLNERSPHCTIYWLIGWVAMFSWLLTVLVIHSKRLTFLHVTLCT